MLCVMNRRYFYSIIISKRDKGNLQGIRYYSMQNSDLYGKEIAEPIADLLFDRKVNIIHQDHRDYCGIGFASEKNQVTIAKVWDGCPIEPLKVWKLSEKECFIDWLSKQSDYSLSGEDEKNPPFYETDPWAKNNQRISRSILISFIRKYY